MEWPVRRRRRFRVLIRSIAVSGFAAARAAAALAGASACPSPCPLAAAAAARTREMTSSRTAFPWTSLSWGRDHATDIRGHESGAPQQAQGEKRTAESGEKRAGRARMPQRVSPGGGRRWR